MEIPMIAETVVFVQLDAKRALRFNGNSMAAYERETGKFYLESIAALYEAYQEIRDLREADALKKDGEAGLAEAVAAAAGPEKTAAEAKLKKFQATRAMKDFSFLARRISISDIRAMVWAALHEYDQDDNPSWPLTINQVGRLLSPSTVLSVVPQIIRGQTENSPTVAEVGESSGPQKPTRNVVQLTKPNGGAAGIELDADAFGSTDGSLGG